MPVVKTSPNIHELFVLEDCTEKCLSRQHYIRANIENIVAVAEQTEEPQYELDEYCEFDFSPIGQVTYYGEGQIFCVLYDKCILQTVIEKFAKNYEKNFELTKNHYFANAMQGN